MTTAYTPLLGLALPTTGELTGTWGTTVNDAITSLLDTAVAGTTTLSADSDVTLSSTTGASNQARAAIILWTASGTVTRSITAPAQSKAYVVINATGGTQSIVFRGAGPTTGVTIAAGDKALIAWNGSDFIRVGASAGGSNTQVQYNSSGNLAGSANLTFDGTNLIAANIKSSKFQAYKEAVNTIGTVSSATYNIDLSTANIFDITLGANVTFTFTNPPSSGTAQNATIILRQDATGNRLATFTNAKYTDGQAPVLSTGGNQVDVLTFFTVNGGSFYFGTFAMANVS